MNRPCSTLTAALALAALALGPIAACGGADLGTPPLRGDFRAPAPRPNFLSIVPAFDVSGLVDPSLADRLVLDEVTLNAAEVRLLGADPQIPVGGLVLTQGDHILSTLGDPARFAIPEGLGSDDLGVFLKLGQQPALGGASVIVRARLYASSLAVAGLSLEAADPEGDPAHPTQDQAADPEGDPAHPTDDEAADPEGDPAHPKTDEAADPEGDPAMRPTQPTCAADPEGDPAHCAKQVRRALKRSYAGPFVRLELRGADAADLVLRLDSASNLQVVVGIPAERWLTPEALGALQASFQPHAPGAALEHLSTTSERSATGAVILSSKERADLEGNQGGSSKMTPEERGDYRLIERDEVDPSQLRQR